MTNQVTPQVRELAQRLIADEAAEASPRRKGCACGISRLRETAAAARMLSRNVGFTVIAVLALALGIGMNAAVFTCYKAFFALSLDALNPGQMVNVAVVHPSGHTDPAFSYPDYLEYRDQLHSFGGLIAES